MPRSKQTKFDYFSLVRKSIAAALLIGLGDYVLLKLGQPLGPFLFSFGLLGVCVLGANLFTGKCGFLIEDKIDPHCPATFMRMHRDATVVIEESLAKEIGYIQ